MYEGRETQREEGIEGGERRDREKKRERNGRREGGKERWGREQWGRRKGWLEGGRGGRKERGGRDGGSKVGRRGQVQRVAAVTRARCCSAATSVCWDLMMDATTQPIYLTNEYLAPVLSTVATHL